MPFCISLYHLTFLFFTEDHISLSSGDEPELLAHSSKSPIDDLFHAAGDRLVSPKLSDNIADDVTEQISQPETPTLGLGKVRSRYSAGCNCNCNFIQSKLSWPGDNDRFFGR